MNAIKEAILHLIDTKLRGSMNPSDRRELETHRNAILSDAAEPHRPIKIPPPPPPPPSDLAKPAAEVKPALPPEISEVKPVKSAEVKTDAPVAPTQSDVKK